jgi:hypothetical protein
MIFALLEVAARCSLISLPLRPAWQLLHQWQGGEQTVVQVCAGALGAAAFQCTTRTALRSAGSHQVCVVHGAHVNTMAAAGERAES